jgi:signal transduction histidine kinase
MRSGRHAVDGHEGGPSGFAWRAVLIVLPVLLLALFGGLSLRQDRRLVESEIRERSQAHAEQAAESCLRMLLEQPRLGAQRVDATGLPGEGGAAALMFRIAADGRLLSPPDYAEVPEPQLRDTSRLTEQQAALWKRLESEADHTTNRLEGWREFLAGGPPEEFAALGYYRFGCLLASQGHDQATNALQTLISGYPDSLGETGLPLFTLAAHRLGEVELGNLAEFAESRAAVFERLCSNVVTRPSALTPWILERASERAERHPAGAASVGTWSAAWQQDEIRRAEYRSAQTAAAGRQWPPIFWYRRSCNLADMASGVTAGDHGATSAALAVRVGTFDRGDSLYVVREPESVSSHMEVASPAAALPDYVGVQIQVAGRAVTGQRGASAAHEGRWQRNGGSGSGVVLAQATRAMEDGTEAVRVIVSLVDPAGLYRRQRQRLFWFGSLIAVSAAVALTGLASTWAALRRQQALYEMQSNFVSSVTHELRAPLGALRLIAENFERGKVREPGEQQRFFQYMVQECSRLSAMIENVLGLARIEQGRQTYEFQETDVARLLEDTVRLMRAGAGERGVDLLLEIDPGQFQAVGDAAVVDGPALQRAVINLIDNAIKHSPAASRVTVGAARVQTTEGEKAVQGAGGNLRIRVGDKGPGIPESEQAKIFERFYRRGSELRRESAGAGIGLSIVKHVVEAHHGKISVESRSGEGSQFVMEIPWRPPQPHRFPLSGRMPPEGRGSG